jgi:hypothetical protein
MKAKFVCETLGGTWYGSYGVAFCPAHENQRTPALSLSTWSNGTLLAKCFAGCQFKEVIVALRARGILDGSFDRNPAEPLAVSKSVSRSSARNSAAARKIWAWSRPVQGTLAEKYMASRGITCELPESLRFHAELYHGPSKRHFPALVARIDGASEFAIHRTYLSPNGFCKARVNPEKMMLGPAQGGAVLLGAVDNTIMIGEGIETCLSAYQVTGLPAFAALSTSGMRGLVLPKCVSDVTILADNDPAGEAAAYDCARRYEMPGRRVRIVRPPFGSDFNDLLQIDPYLVENVLHG